MPCPTRARAPRRRCRACRRLISCRMRSFFFFSSRRRHTRLVSWSSDVCSSDLLCMGELMIVLDTTIVNVALPSIREALLFTETSLVWVVNAYMLTYGGFLLLGGRLGDLYRSEERRVGKEGRSRWSPYH